MVEVDRFSKNSTLYSNNNENITSKGVAKNLWKLVFKDTGLPQKVISDRGCQFVSKFMKELCNQLGIERNSSTAYHPQTDGQTERVNQEMEQYLQLYISYRQEDWAEWLPMTEFAHNNRQHSSTRKSPFFVYLGRHPNIHGEGEKSTGRVPEVDEFVQKIRKAAGEVERALKKTNEVMKKKADKKRGEAIEYTEGDLVWVEGSNINSDRPAKKLAFKRAGPFPVIKKVRSSAYELKIPKMWKNLHPVINESKLKPYHYPTFAQQQESSLTVISPSRKGAIQEVEKILNSRRRGDNLQYLVNGRANHLKNQPGRTDTRSSRGPHSYVEIFTRTTRTHPGSLQLAYPGNHTAKSRRRDLRREVML